MQIETTPAVIRNDLSEIRSTIFLERDNGSDHRAAAIDLQAEKAARPAAPCASYCYVVTPLFTCVVVALPFL